MYVNWLRCFNLVLTFEGGYVNHPKDPGGPTNFGITQRVYDQYRRTLRKPVQTVAAINREEVEAIYKFQFWDAVLGDRLPAGIDMAVYDYAVNSGVVKAAIALQRALGSNHVDGHIGLSTLSLANAADRHKVAAEIFDNRLTFLKRLKNWAVFGKGWNNRIRAAKAAALNM